LWFWIDVLRTVLTATFIALKFKQDYFLQELIREDSDSIDSSNIDMAEVMADKLAG
jgi:hypothetical protein